MSNIFNDLMNGDYSLEEVLTEAVYPDAIPYNKTLRKQINLPQGFPIGKGNLCFLYTHNLKESIEIMTNKENFLSHNRYKYYFYNLFYQGKIYNVKYRFREMEERKKIYKEVEDNTNIIPRLKLPVSDAECRNMYFDLFRYLEIFENICKKLQPMKYITMYWEFMTRIFNMELVGYHNKFVVVDIRKFPIKDTLKENLRNPLFLLYYTSMRKLELLKNVNIDFYFFNNRNVLKINPSTLDEKSYTTIRIEMKKLMAHISPDNILTNATDDMVIQKDEIKDTAIGNVVSKINVVKEPDIITTQAELVKLNATVAPIAKEVEDKVTKTVNKVVEKIPDEKVDIDSVVNKVTDVSTEEINKDKEMLEKIYQNMAATNVTHSVISTARDEMLKKDQQKLKVGDLTIQDLTKIDATKTTIPVKDISKSLSTTNENMKQLKFINYEKAYNEKLMKKDLTDAILSLNDKSIPMFVRDIKVQDTSDELNFKDTYTILLEDTNRKRHTIKVDIPKFVEDRFLYIGGNKKIIKHQSFFYPVVKTGADTVQVVTNYNKMIIQRVESKSGSSIERFKKLLSQNDALKENFTFANVFVSNKEYVTTVEYDELSKFISMYKNGSDIIFFDQGDVKLYIEKNGIKVPDKKFFIGKVKGKNIFIDVNTQKTDDDKSVIDIILSTLDSETVSVFEKIRAPKRLMYTKVKVMSQFVSVGLLLGLWEGLSTVLKKLNVKYRLEDKIPQSLNANETFIKFHNCFMVYEETVPISLIMNGFRLIETGEYDIEEFDAKSPYIKYIIKVYGSANIENALMNVYEFMIDPISYEILKELNYPTDFVSLVIYAVSLLADSQFIPEINQGLSRIRSNEIIPAILYERLAKNYITYRNSNGRKKFSIPQDCVIKEVLGLKTVEDYSTLNPTLELEMSHAVSTKGFRGANLDESYTLEKRSYDPSMIGVIAPSTSPDGSVGVNKTLTMEPDITNLRGFVDIKSEKLDSLKDVNLFSPGELSIPLGATIDDSTRLGHALKQSKHVIPVKNSSPVLISNGLEESARFQLTSDFVVNAEEDGEIIDYDEESKTMIAKYKSGKCQAINLAPTIVKNGGGGFFLSNKLITTYKVGDKFKKDEVLAYHKDFFTNGKFNNCRMNMGTMTKVAIMSTYNTYEDSTFITEKLSEDAATEMCFCKPAVIGKNSNIDFMVEKGQEISVGDTLIRFDTSYDDESLNALLANLAEDEKNDIIEESHNEIKSKYSGVIEDIKIYATVELDEMSPSLRKIVGKYYRGINRKKEFLNKYDPEGKDSIVKCGMLVTDSSHKIMPNKFGVIKGQHVEDSILIEFYIKHTEALEIGSKIANFTALKNTIGEILPKGYEPWSEYRPDEEISSFIASNSILNRMTPSILLTALGNKCIIELKRHLEDIYNE